MFSGTPNWVWMVKRLRGKKEKDIFLPETVRLVSDLEEIGLVNRRDIKGQVICSFAENGGIKFHYHSAKHVLAKMKGRTKSLFSWDISKLGVRKMLNPLDSLWGTVIAGVILTIFLYFIVRFLMGL